MRNLFKIISVFLLLLFVSCRLPRRSVEINSVKAAYVNQVAPDAGLAIDHEVFKIRNGDNLYNILIKRGYSPNEVYYLSEDIQNEFDLTHLKPGMELFFEKDNSFFFYTDDFRKIHLHRKESENLLEVVSLPYQRREVFKQGIVESSLYDTAVKSEIPLILFAEIVDYMAFDIDFQRDIKQGTRFSIIYEENICQEADFTSYGEIIYYEIETLNDRFSYFRYEDVNGKVDFFDSNGVSARKNLLRTPVDGAVVSSSFGWRTSPITGFSHKHKGIDFAAPEGAPIYAAGDGVVKAAGFSEIYGNYLLIRHMNGYDSFYAHLSRFASQMMINRSVSQKQVIGYVGSTGMSTGPHCHYELRYEGVQINPSLMKQTADRQLCEEELYLFQQFMESLASSYGLDIDSGEDTHV